MFKLQFFLIFILLVGNNLYGQVIILEVEITSKDNAVSSDNVIALKDGLQSVSNGKLHMYSQIDKILVRRKDGVINFNILNTKTEHIGTTKNQMGIGYKVYDSEKLEHFYVIFGEFHKVLYYFTPKISSNPNREIFIRRKGDSLVYNIGFVDGFGWEGVKSRIKSFFDDCPTLFEKMKKQNMSHRNIVEISKLYNEFCK